MSGPTSSSTQPQPEAGLRAVAVNLLGLVEHPQIGDSPYRVDQDGHSYVPAGDGGIVLGLQLGESVFARDADHAAPGACLTHPDQAARHALATYACIGNQVVVRTGRAAGARGTVLGQRGELGRVIVGFAQEDLARLRPADQVAVRACGQGWRPPGLPRDVVLLNLDPAALAVLPVAIGENGEDGAVTAGVRMTVPSKLAGNGIGRPSASWDLDLQLQSGPGDGPGHGPGDGPGGSELRLGDLVAVTDIDARYNMGYRSGWVTVGLVVHGASPLPGHGPGITPILTGPADVLRARPDGAEHTGLTEAALRRLTEDELELQ